RDEAPSSFLAPLLLAWLPLSLVTAWGFHDFLLGAALLPLLLDALERGGIARILLVLTALFFLHLFVFAVGIALLGLRSLSRRDLRVLAGAVAMAGAIVLATTDVLGAGISWDVDWGQRLVHLVFTNVLYTVSPAGIAAGVAWTVLIVYGLVRLPRTWPAWAGAALLLVAVVSPAVFAGGSFTFERVHLLALVALAPVVVRAAARLPARAAGAVGLVLVTALGLTFLEWTRAGDVLDADRAEIRALFRDIDVPASRLRVASALPVGRLKVGRAVFHEHVADRAAMDLGLVAADDYEADSPAYPVAWKGDRRGLRIRRVGTTLHLDRVPTVDTYIVHEPGARFARHPAVIVAAGRRFVVSRVAAMPADEPGRDSPTRPAPARADTSPGSIGGPR
ncbi:MAG: hypothetical protein GWM90_09350, partial [Gemmatimonadetes bacterium]|nr:hypothetical protein [Gemmatimonadota bacterium]NIQ54109.1 hypothetical protein [Gemmatimonadota bacterium]NIU74307.1 hypothetical protein [Gammaproteobacteria bacterium]NIX44312.1 hypothetical protein [Gemmatimonadota bacterium]NIY08534.1 hypothetical protein [Gemmatimonadota bacterium]